MKSLHDVLEDYRLSYANDITSALTRNRRQIAQAFAATSREQYLGPPPWHIFTGAKSIDALTNDPALLYQDVLVSVRKDGSINNGQPSLHALCFSTLNLKQGEKIVHVGAGTGYYSAILARLAGQEGLVDAYEIEPDLARRATEQLGQFGNVVVHARSGSEGVLPGCDVIYVNAGATHPLDLWLDALHPGGRLLFPLTPDEEFGGMLLIKRRPRPSFDARFISSAAFVPCAGARNATTALGLSHAFRRPDVRQVQSFHRGTEPNRSCWFAGDGWWLSTAPAT